MTRVVRWSLTFWLLVCSNAAYLRQVTADESESLGLFESHADVGVVLHPGSVRYDDVKKTYTVTASGENMWFAKDAFHYVWKKASGDLSLSADVSFLGKGVDPHRKACLIFRQTLDADSVYADVALHGDGLVSLQFREAKGGETRSAVKRRSAQAHADRKAREVHLHVSGV